ncbi:MAG: hypothetical protein ABR589_12585, partial [Chthoniobacterales bacterium]
VKGGPKKVLVRARGPSLEKDGQPWPGTLQDPVVELFQQGNPNPIASNDNWTENRRKIKATGLAPKNELEAALIAEVDPDVSYTAHVKDKNGQPGVGLVEIFELNAIGNSKLGNLSSRAFVGTGDNVLIGGVIAGPSTLGDTKAVFRATGPSLKDRLPNALDDTILTLYDRNGNPIAENDDWQQSPNALEIQSAGLQPSRRKESALLAELAPGAPYTAIVRGKGDDNTGIGIVEIFYVP